MINKQEFIRQFKISDAVPVDPSGRSIRAEAFGEAISEFINDNFRGIAEVSTEIKAKLSVMICAEYTAYYFKTLLSFLHGRVYLNIHISDDKDALKIKISSNEAMPLSFEESNYLIKLARNAGMEIYPEDREIRLTLCYSETALHGVYAISVADGKRILLSKLNEIFF